MKNLIRIVIVGFLMTMLVPASASGFSGGLLQADMTLTKANSPYQITEPIQIPEGVTLTVEEGVEIFSNSGKELFYVNGTVKILGSATEPVRITSKGTVFYPKNARTARIEVRYAAIDGQGSGSLVAPTGYSQYAHYSFTDCDFTNFGYYSYIWYPLSFVAERNVFSNSPGFSIGFDGRYGNPAPVFRNNLFIGAPKSTYGKQYWIEAWASYGSTLEVSGNTFSGGPYTAIWTTTTYDVLQLNARANYWGSTDAGVVASMVKDKSDGLDYGTLIDTSGFLTAPNPTSPASLRFQVLTNPTPAPTQTQTPTPTPTTTPPSPSGNSGASASSRVREVRVSAPSTALPGTSLRIGFTFLDSNGKPVTDELVTLSNSGPGFFMNGGQQKPNADGVVTALILLGIGDTGIVSVTANAGGTKTTATVLVSAITAPQVPTPSAVGSPTAVKYKNCTALQKVYPGGVAKSASSINKGGRIRLAQVVNAKVYELNKSLDRDKDGLVCEK